MRAAAAAGALLAGRGLWAERGPAHQDPESGSTLGHMTSASLLQFPGSLWSSLVLFPLSEWLFHFVPTW